MVWSQTCRIHTQNISSFILIKWETHASITLVMVKVSDYKIIKSYSLSCSFTSFLTNLYMLLIKQKKNNKQGNNNQYHTVRTVPKSTGKKRRNRGKIDTANTYVQLSPLIFLTNNLFGMIYICSIISLDFSDEQPLWYDIHMFNYLPWFFWWTTSLVWYTYVQLSPLIFLMNNLFGMIYICSIISLDFSDEQPLWYDIHMFNFLVWYRHRNRKWWDYISFMSSNLPYLVK